MGKQRKKIIVAGPLVYESIYPLPSPRDSRVARQGKKKLTSDAQQRMNQKYQWQKCELLMACNFRPGDIVLTLTFDDAHLPDSRAGVMRCVREFFKRLRARRNPQIDSPVERGHLDLGAESGLREADRHTADQVIAAPLGKTSGQAKKE